MDIRAWRQEFPILARKNYLNSCSLGALSRRAEERVRQFQLDWHEYGASAWYETWMGRLTELRGRIAGMLGAGDREIALAASTSAALGVIASALDYHDRPDVVVAELDFPTIAYAWIARPGVNLIRVRSDDGATIDLARYADAVTERTAVIATSHVFFTTGAIQDIAALAEIAHARGALLVVDAYQSAGQVPIDVDRNGADVLITGPLKWLLGGPGLAYLYVREGLIRGLRPQLVGWFGAEGQFDFDISSYEPKRDARRFELGTPSLPTVHSALGGQEIIDEVGVPGIRARNGALTERLIGALSARGFQLRMAPQAEARSAIVMVAESEPSAAVAHLAEAGIIVDWRPGYVRISPHFYNTEDEVDQVVEELGRWRNR